jgi:hypothetical protein
LIFIFIVILNVVLFILVFMTNNMKNK